MKQQIEKAIRETLVVQNKVSIPRCVDKIHSLMEVEIEFKEWDHTCGDGCCSDYGTDIIVNGEKVTEYGDHSLEKTIKLILDKIGVKHNL